MNNFMFEVLCCAENIGTQIQNNSSPSITDWLMVIITVVYVVATIAICIANFSSANASKKQLEESKRQHEETKRLQLQPYFQCDKCKAGDNNAEYSIDLALDSSDLSGGTCEKSFSISNIGSGSAKEITYIWNNSSGSYDKGAFVFQSLKGGEEKLININFAFPSKYRDNYLVSIDLFSKDLLEITYKQRIQFEFEKNKSDRLAIKNNTVYPPELIIKEQNNE